MQLKKELILEAFQQNAVLVDIDSLILCKMEEGVTNQFFSISCKSGASYLVRCNGKLWHPFTRKNEDYNLTTLYHSQIPTNVLYNDYIQGFQICYLPDSGYQFNNLPIEKRTPALFAEIGNMLKKIHDIKYFKNSYCIPSTIKMTYERISPGNKQILKRFYPDIKRLMSTIIPDTDNLVSSHNDLLPSSIYYKDTHTTFVDWEYSGMNHRGYDLALFSIKAALNLKQEMMIINSYDKQNRHDTLYNVTLMKPIVNFLLLQWHMASSAVTEQSINRSISLLFKSLASAAKMHACRLSFKVGFFHEHKQKEEENLLEHGPYSKARL